MKETVVEMMEIPPVVPLYGVQPPEGSLKGKIGIIATIVTGVIAVAIGVFVYIKRKSKKKKGEISNEEIKK